MTVSYQDHLDWLIRQEAGARAERYGFEGAKLYPALLTFSSDEYEQMRYRQGYEDGQSMLSTERTEDV